MKQLVEDYYKIFTKSLFGYEIELEEKALGAFCKRIGVDQNSLGEWFVWNYLCYQFTYWTSKRTRFDHKIQVSWILGPKAIERWNNKPESWNYYVDEFLKKKAIRRPTAYHKAEGLALLNEDDRKRYSSQVDGFLSCINEDLYNERSITCLTCKNRQICKKMIE